MTRAEDFAARRAKHRQAILDVIGAGVADIHKIALSVGLTTVHARKHLAPLLGGPAGGGLVRISHWHDPDATLAGRENYPRPFYALGPEPDEPKPRAKQAK